MPRSRRSRGLLQPADGVACGPRERRLYSVGETENAGFHLSFQRSPGHQLSTWPDPASSMQLHLHFRVDDLEAAERAVLALGGTMFDDQPGDGSRVYADPAGHPFCLVLTRDRIE